MSEVVVRRLGKNQVRLVRGLQDAERSLVDHYPNHHAWLDEALEEVKVGLRLAFGAFAPTSSGLGSCLGSVLLKRGRYSDHLELKNLVVNKARLPSSEERRLVRQALLKKAADFAETRGFGRLEVELPASEVELIENFVESRFRIYALRSSRFRPSESVYLMHKVLRASYLGDPFELGSLAQWVLTSHLGAKPIVSEDLTTELVSGEEGAAVLESMRFELGRWPDLDLCEVDESRGKEQFSLRGLAFAVSGSMPADIATIVGPIKNQIAASISEIGDAPDLILAFVEKKSEELMSALRKIGARTIVLSEIQDLLGPAAKKRAPLLDTSEVGGILLDVEPSFKARIMISGRQGFGYHVLSGIGNSTLSLEGSVALLSTPEIRGGEARSVWGIADVVGVSGIDPFDVKEEHILNSLWETLDEFQFYFSERYRETPGNQLVVLRCGPPVIFRESLSLTEFADETFLSAIDEDATFSGPATCYVDRKSVANLQRVVASRDLANSGGEEEMLESLASALEVLRGARELAAVGGRITELIESLRRREAAGEVELEGPLARLVQGQIAQLDIYVEEFNAVRSVSTYDQAEAVALEKRIASKALEILNRLGPEHVPDYALLKEVFERVVS